MPCVHFVILQPTPFCNIDCKYCYLPHRSSNGRMSPETIGRVFSGLFASGWVTDDLHVVWHGGEPLVLPTGYYEEAFRIIAALTPAHVKVSHGFQTNAMFIDERWCKFFKEHDATVGVSIDGPQAIHDANRVTRSGKGTYSSAIGGIRCLRRNAVEFSVITVLTALSLDHPRELHDFYVSEGITNVCFNVEEIEGCNLQSSLAGPDIQARYENFMREFWNLNTASGGLYYIREFKDMLQKIVRPLDIGEIDNTLVEPFAHLNVDYEGNFSTFSPEFLGHKNAYYSDFIIGNFWKDSLSESLESASYRRLYGDVAAGVALCRESCEYFPICGGGSPVNKLYENGSIVSSETMYCRLNVKTIADLALEVIDNSAAQLAKASDAGREPPVTVAVASAAASRGPACPEAEKLGNDGIGAGERRTLWDADIEAGVSRITVYSQGVSLAGDRLQLSSRTMQPSSGVGAWSYEKAAIIPANAWRSLTRAERGIVIADACPGDFGMCVGVTRLPSELLEPFAALRARARTVQSEEEIAPLLDDAQVRQAMRSAARHLMQHLHRPPTALDDAPLAGGIAVKPPGLATVTVESSTRQLVGLHLDDWYSFPLAKRRRSPNRICVNLGSEDRFFLFLNLPVGQMQKELTRAGRGSRAQCGATEIARAFMTVFPRYPVLRLRIAPGEAYIAPTETIAHDASSIGMSGMDVSLQIRGKFALSGNRQRRSHSTNLHG